MTPSDKGSYKITVHLQRRRDGGLRAWSDDVPGLVLSNKDPKKVLADIEPALEGILSEMMGCAVKTTQLAPFPLAASRPLPAKQPIWQAAITAIRGRQMEFAAAPCH